MSQVSYGTITINDITDITDIFLQYCMVADNVTANNITENSWFILSDDTTVEDKYYYILNNLDGKYYVVTAVGSENPSNLGWYEDNPYPNWQSGYQIWIREVKIKEGINLPEYGTPYLDTAVNQINNQYVNLDNKLRNFFYPGDSTYPGAFAVSKSSIEGLHPEDATTYGFNTRIGVASISMGYNKIPLFEAGLFNENNISFNGIRLYSPILTNGVITNHRLDATLDSNGLKLFKGGIVVETVGSNNGIYISSDNLGSSVESLVPTPLGGTSKTNWRAVIGSKFGVDSEGNLYANNANLSNATVEGAITATSLTIGSGSSAYNGEAAINISGYSIEITSDSTNLTDSTYLYPHLYHNGSEVIYFLSVDTTVNSSKTYYTRSGTVDNYTYTAVTNPSGNPVTNQYYEHIDYSHFIWYQDNETIGTEGDANNYGRYLATYEHSYRVVYEFDDGEVGSGAEVQTRLVDPSKYITKINDYGITIHPEDTSNNNFLQITANGVDIVKNNITVASYGSNIVIGSTSGKNVLIDSNGIQLKNSSTILANFGTNQIQIGANGTSRAIINTDGLTVYKGSDNIAQFGTTTRVGKEESSRFLMNTDSLQAYNSNNQKYFEVNASGLTWGNNTAATTTQVSAAAQTASNYITTVGNDGIKLHPHNEENNYTLINSNGMQIYQEIDNVATKIAEFSSSGTLIGEVSGAHTTIDEDGMQIYSVDVNDNLVELANIGYGEGIAQSGTATAPYYTFGIRQSGSTIGNYSLAEGTNTTASGYSSHAEGRNTTAEGNASHAEGANSRALWHNAHAEGIYTTASGYSSHAEGISTIASEEASHAEGYKTIASGIYSHAQNYYTVATEMYQTVIGKYNSATRSGSGTTANPYTYSNVGDYAFIIGNGSGDDTSNRSNAFTVDWNGNLTAYGNIDAKVNTYDYTKFTYSSGFTYYSTAGEHSPKACKFGRIVNLSGTILVTTARSSTGGVTIGKVPSGCEPLYEMHCHNNFGANHCRVVIRPNGDIHADLFPANPAVNSWISLDCTYISKA